jgi:4-amino-4-deoxy-L-arabinose transferase-like glycosyltransferase
MDNPPVNPDTSLIIWSVFGLFLLLSVIPWLIALIDVLRNEFKAPNNKLIWLLTLVLVPVLGCVLYFFIGRKQKI